MAKGLFCVIISAVAYQSEYGSTLRAITYRLVHYVYVTEKDMLLVPITMAYRLPTIK